MVFHPIRKSIRFLFCLGMLVMFLLVQGGLSLASEEIDDLREEVQRIEGEINEVLEKLDRLAQSSEGISREVQVLKSMGKRGMIDQLRMGGLLSRLREILLERQKLKEIESNLNSGRKKKAARLHDHLGEKVRFLLAEGEREVRNGNTTRADQLHQEVLAFMQERQRLVKRRPPHIPVLPEVVIPDTEGISLEKREEMAILLKNDAESLGKKKLELVSEREFLQNELKIKRSFARFQGFPRGLVEKPMDKQVLALEEKLALFDRSILEYTHTINALMEGADEMIQSVRKSEAELLK